MVTEGVAAPPAGDTAPASALVDSREASILTWAIFGIENQSAWQEIDTSVLTILNAIELINESFVRQLSEQRCDYVNIPIDDNQAVNDS